MLHRELVPMDLIDHLVDWAMVVDQQGLVRYISQGVRRYGGDPDIIGMSWETTAMAVHAPFFTELMKSVAPGNPRIAGPISAEVTVPRGDRRCFDATAYRAEESGEIRYVCLFQDVTEVRRFQASMVQLDRMVAVAHLTTGVAHNFNNALGGIMLNTGLLVTAEGEERERLADRVMASSERGAVLCRKLQNFARTESPTLGPVAVTPMLADLVSLFETEARRHAVTVAWELKAEVVVEADRGQLQQILLDLLLHARAAVGSHGAIQLLVTRHDREAQMAVSHSGPAIPAEQLPFVFEPFFGTGGSRIPGAGVGLAVSQILARGMGGRIDVENRPGTGTTFTLVLPCTGISHNTDSSQEASR